MARIIAVTAVLLAASAGSAASGATGPPLSISGARADEGGRATLVVRLSRPAPTRVAVRFTTAEGSATVGDYARASGTLSFAPGQRTKLIRVATVNDDVAEDDESFRVRLRRPRNARIARSTAEVTIFASDLPGPFATVANLEGEGRGTATLTFDPEAALLRSTVTASGLRGPAAAVHLHRGAEGGDGPLLATLVGPSDNGSASGSTPFSRALILQILAAPHEFYVDVHTQAHPSGALRGQLRPTS